MDYYPFFRPLIHMLPAEAAHRLAVRALALGLVPPQPNSEHPSLTRTVGGVSVCNPVGLAAGFDKNGEAVAALFNQGFGFVECGTVTPKPQEGNPKPRVFRLAEDGAIINRMGFNNAGLLVLKSKLERQMPQIEKARARGQALGINIGKNKDSEDAVADYVTMLDGVYPYADYITLNISSPNTPGLRDLQSGSALSDLLDTVCERREQLMTSQGRRVPLWLKVAPDLDDAQCEAMVETLKAYPLDALIVSNTTLSRPESLKSPGKSEVGGLSGKPLMELSTSRLALFHRLLAGKLPLVGVGGIATPDNAAAKFTAGASLVQLYSALTYRGFSLVNQIKQRLIADAQGTRAQG